jgi:transcription elongation GreA/GreB family factor
MSKAFVKEDADGASEVLPDREISHHANLVTEEGLAQIDAIIAKLEKQQADANASEGDAPSLARDLRYWTAQRTTAQLTPNSGTSQVRFGCRVTVERSDGGKETYRLVGVDEADPKHGTLSYVSPLAQALIDREVGDTIEVGATRRKIIEIA